MRPALPLILLVLAAPLLAEESPAEAVPTDSKIVVLKPVKVQGTAASNFAIDVRIFVDAASKKVNKMVISRVSEHSDAAALGLQVGDEIVKINGTLVEGMDGRVDKDSPIGLLLLNRKTGDSLTLDVVSVRTRTITLHAQSALW